MAPGGRISLEGLRFGASDFKFGEVILCERRSTSYDLASLFRGKRNALDRWSGEIARLSIFEGSPAEPLRSRRRQLRTWRRSRRICFVFKLADGWIDR